jgi:hypothetical protein
VNDSWVDDWAESVEELFRRWGKGLFALGGLLVYALSAVVWHLVTNDSPLKSLYWATQTGTTVGYGTGWNSFDDSQMVLCILAMLFLSTYWSTLLSVLGSYVAAWKAE